MASLADASLTADERTLVEAFVDELSARLGGALQAVWLFGSRARGERSTDEWSDVDLLVIADDASWDGRQRVYAALDAAAAQLGLDALAWSLSVHVRSPSWLAQRRAIGSFFVGEVDRDKVVLWGSA
jgi:predicted nucleotidyltransferase